MSTAHQGGYCTHRDKMILSQSEAARMAKRIGGMATYKCDHCTGWHLCTSKKDGRRFNRINRRERRTRKSRKQKPQ